MAKPLATKTDAAPPHTQVQGRSINLRSGFVETEQGFKLNRHTDGRDLKDVLQQAVETDPDHWRSYRVEQAIIDPSRITKTRVRVFHNGDGKPQVMVTFKGKNDSTPGNPVPRFEMDLPIDLELLAKMNPGHTVSECLGELFRFGSEGLVGKDRFKYSPSGQCKRAEGERSFDVDLYDWSEEALAAMKSKKRRLYDHLAITDVEMSPGDRIGALGEFPEALQPFVATHANGALYDITGDKRFKGRTLTNMEARADQFSLSQTIADLVNLITGSKSAPCL